MLAVVGLLGKRHAGTEAGGDERHPDALLVEGELLEHLMPAGGLAVVGREQDQGVVGAAGGLQGGQHHADLRVHLLHEAVQVPRQGAPLQLRPAARTAQDRPVDEAIVVPAHHAVGHGFRLVVMEVRRQRRQLAGAQDPLRHRVGNQRLLEVVPVLAHVVRIDHADLQEEGLPPAGPGEELHHRPGGRAVVVLAAAGTDPALAHVEDAEALGDVAAGDVPLAGVVGGEALGVQMPAQVGKVVVQHAPVVRHPGL